MTQSYLFDIPSDFPNGKLSSDRLTLEISQAGITYALVAINTVGASCEIIFASALSPTDEDKLNVVVAAHYGEPLSRENFDVHGNPVFAPTFLSTSEQARLEGYEISCEPDSTAILDVEVTVQMLVQGGQFWSQDCVRGDKAHFSVVDKNDVLGLHTANGIPFGTPIELVRYVKNYRLPTTTLFQEDIIMPTVAPIAPGLFLRTVYEAVAGGTTRHTGILYRWYIGT